MGLVFQYPEHQLFETDVFADVCFGPKNMGLSKKETELAAFEALRMVHFPEDLYYASVFELSGGQKRRAAIAGVLAMKPDFLVLDEPTAGLDPVGRLEILGMVSELHKKSGLTIILVSHSMEDVATYVERVIVMDRGRVAYDDTPREVFSHAEELYYLVKVGQGHHGARYDKVKLFLLFLAASLLCRYVLQPDGRRHLVAYAYLLGCAVYEFELTLRKHDGQRYAREASSAAEVHNPGALAEVDGLGNGKRVQHVVFVQVVYVLA